MPPPVALGLFVAFILWLFVRDARRPNSISAALWLPLTWAFVIGSRPVSLWFGIGSTGADGHFEDSLLDKGLFFFLIVAGAFVLIRRRAVCLNSIRRNKWLFLYFLYLGMSVLWADDPFVSFKRWVKDFGNVVMVMVVLSEENSVEATRVLLARSAYLVIPLSVLVTKYYPAVSRAYDIWNNQPSFRGLTMGKNMLGMSLFVSGLSLFWLWLGTWEGETRTNKMALAECSILSVATVWLLSIAHSATAVTCTTLGGCILLALRVPSLRRQVRWLGTYSVGLVIVVLFLQASGLSTMFMTQFTQTVGRDPTMHGRDTIWQSALAEEDVNPLIGAGFYSFWTPERDRRLSKGYYYLLGEVHNGYIETYLTEGLIGLILLMIAIAVAVTRMKREVLLGSSFGAMRLTFTVPILFYNISESIFDRLGVVWFVMILMMMVESRTVQERSASPLPLRVSDHSARPNAGKWAAGRRWDPLRGGADTLRSRTGRPTAPRLQ